MKQSNFSAYAFTAILSVLAAYVVGIGQTLDSYTYVLDDEQYEASGLHKLTEGEISNLFRFVESIPRVSFLEESAANYVRDDNYKVAQIFGVQKLRLRGSDAKEDYLVGIADQHIQILRLPIIKGRLAPGWYWAKMSGATWTIMLPDGDEVLYWVEETRE